MSLWENRKYSGALLGGWIRGTIKGNGISTSTKIFRVRRGNGSYGAAAGKKYQDKYDYFIPDSINNSESNPFRQQWKY